MPDFWALTVPAAIGAFAWLYQKAWERHERRVKQYEEIISHLPAFTEARQDPKRIDLVLAEHRRLWLFGPDEVIRAFDRFLAVVEGPPQSDEVKETVLAEFVLAMRRDASFWSSVVPRFFRTHLETREIKLKSATPIPPKPIEIGITQHGNVLLSPLPPEFGQQAGSQQKPPLEAHR